MKAIISHICPTLLLLLLAVPMTAQKSKQKVDVDVPPVVAPPAELQGDSIYTVEDSIKIADISKLKPERKKRDWNTWRPDVKLSLIHI